MRLRYHDDGRIIEVEIPDGSRVSYRSHEPVGGGAFLDDLLLVPWEGREVPIPGEAVPILAGYRMYGLTPLASCRPETRPGSEDPQECARQDSNLRPAV